ncbi:MAG: hypothetical protein ACJ789_02135 [Thermomicrobiales bacterium]
MTESNDKRATSPETVGQSLQTDDPTGADVSLITVVAVLSTIALAFLAVILIYAV